MLGGALVAAAVLFAVITAVHEVWIVSYEQDDPARDEYVIAASERAGFTHDQAVWLRSGRLDPMGCKVAAFPESACNFFRVHRKGRVSDDQFYTDCDAGGLSPQQCRLLRLGVDGYYAATKTPGL